MSGIVRQLVLLGVALLSTFVYLIISNLKRWSFSFRPWHWERGQLEAALRQSQSYREWQTVATELDRKQGRLEWRKDEASPIYDHRTISVRYHALREAQLAKNTELLMMLLRENMVRNLGGIDSPSLYSYALSGSKILIEDYAQTVVETISNIANDESLKLAVRERFLADSRQAYGRSALLMSGGLGLGMYHFGVAKCLLEQNLLPTVLCGTSIGALVVAILGATPDANLHDLLERHAVNFSAFERLSAGSFKRKVVRLLTRGYIMDVQRLIDFCKDNLGELTFREAYEKTGRTINIVLTHHTHSATPALLNYLTSPNVLLWSAACASCAQPLLYAPVALKAKDFAGRIVDLIPPHSSDHWVNTKADFPMQRMTELFNVNHFIVSQVQPHIIASLRSQRSSSRFSIAHRTAMFAVRELVHIIHVLSVLSNFTPFFSWVRDEVEQTHEGHVTIIPQLSFKALLQMVGNPSASKLDWCTREGERGCFPYINQIRTRTVVERALNSNVKMLRAARKRYSGTEIGEPYATTTSCLQPNASTTRLDSLGRFICPPNDISIPRPCSPPPSPPSNGSPPGVVPQSRAQADSPDDNISLTSNFFNTRNRSNSTPNERMRLATTPTQQTSSVFTPGPTPTPYTQSGNSWPTSNVSVTAAAAAAAATTSTLHAGRSVSPSRAVSPSRSLLTSPSRRAGADIMRTMSLSSSLQSLVAPLTPGPIRRADMNSVEHSSSVD